MTDTDPPLPGEELFTPADDAGQAVPPDPPERADLTPPGHAGRVVTVSGTVRDKNQRALPDTRVDAAAADGTCGRVLTDAYGHYRFCLAAPAVRLPMRVKPARGPELVTAAVLTGDTDPRLVAVPDGAGGYTFDVCVRTFR